MSRWVSDGAKPEPRLAGDAALSMLVHQREEYEIYNGLYVQFLFINCEPKEFPRKSIGDFIFLFCYV